MHSFLERRILCMVRRLMPRLAASLLRCTARLTEDLGLDYLDLIKLTSKLERHYGIHILDEELDELRTVADVTTWVRHRLAVEQVFTAYSTATEAARQQATAAHA